MQLTNNDGGHLGFLMEMYKSGLDSTLPKKVLVLIKKQIQQLLLDGSGIRTRQVMNELDQLLKDKIPSFASFTLEKRMKMYKVMMVFLSLKKYESHAPNTLMCLEGQNAQFFYIILSGKIEVFTVKNSERIRVLKNSCSM